MKPILSFESPRMRARQMTPGDLDDLISLYQNPDVAKTLGGIRERAQVLESMEHKIKHQEKYGFGYWMIEDKQSGSFIGRCGLLHTIIDGKEVIELGYAFLPEFWNKGYATEISNEILRIGFEELGLEEIACFTIPENKASIRVIEKLGFVFEKECDYKGWKHVFYRMTKKQWANEE